VPNTVESATWETAPADETKPDSVRLTTCGSPAPSLAHPPEFGRRQVEPLVRRRAAKASASRSGQQGVTRHAIPQGVCHGIGQHLGQGIPRRSVSGPVGTGPNVGLNRGTRDGRHHELDPCTRRLRRSRTSSGNALVQRASSRDRIESTNTLGGVSAHVGPCGSGPSPYNRRAQRDPAAPLMYSCSCLTARFASVLPRILPFTSTSRGFPTNGSKTSDHTAKSAPVSRACDCATTSVPEETRASATTRSRDLKSFATSERSKRAIRSSVFAPRPTSGGDCGVGCLFGRFGADSI